MTTHTKTANGVDSDLGEHLLVLGAVITITADGESTDHTITVTEIDAPPGYENGLHTHPPSEVFYVLRGAMTLYVNETPHRLTPGMTGFVPANAPHGFRVDGGDSLRTLAMFTPAGIEGFFRDAGERVETRDIPGRVAVTETDWENVIAVSPKYEMKRLGPLPPAD